MRNLLIFLSLLFYTTILFAHIDHGSHLGNIYFPTSGNQEAQSDFERGVKLLHSFEYIEARKAFAQAVQIDPHFVMGYWGIAMTYNHPLWNEQDFLQGRNALNKIAKTPKARINQAKTPIEKGFIEAINLLYGEGGKQDRDIAYKDALQKLYQKYPEHDEVAIFYALSLLGATSGERNVQNYMQSAGISEIVYQHNTNHPGALHYLLHTYDDPTHAPLGLRAARTFSKVAPDASHALHMPSHVFLALGLWDEVIKTNQAAWLAGVHNNVHQDTKAYSVHDLHALQWLSYGYLQINDDKKAYSYTKTMQDIAEKSNLPMAKWYYAMMRAAYIVESQDWNAPLRSLDLSDTEISARVTNMYIDALIALHQGKVAVAKNIYAKMHALIPEKLTKDTFTEYFISTSEHGVKIAKIIEKELDAEIKMFLHDDPCALYSLRAAADMEAKLSEGYGPPVPVKPASELLGDFLLKQEDFAEALKQYQITLQRFPNRTMSIRARDSIPVIRKPKI
jgi:hypothetical protein